VTAVVVVSEMVAISAVTCRDSAWRWCPSCRLVRCCGVSTARQLHTMEERLSWPQLEYWPWFWVGPPTAGCRRRCATRRKPPAPDSMRGALLRRGTELSDSGTTCGETVAVACALPVDGTTLTL